MRKLLALALAAILLLALCGCGATQAQADALLESLYQAQQSLNTYAALHTGQAQEEFHVQRPEDFQWNGQTQLWFLLDDNASPEELVMADALASLCQSGGWEGVKQELKDSSVQALLEQAISAGDVGALVCPQLTASDRAAVQAAADAGIILLTLEADCTLPVAGSVTVDEEALGSTTYDLLSAWVAQSDLETGEAELAVAVYTGGTDSLWLQALAQRLVESDTLYMYAAETDRSDEAPFNAAYLWARQILAENSGLRLFCCPSPETAYGVCYYLEQYAADQELDLSDFCVVWNGQDEDSDTYLSVARESSDYTAARGYVLAQDDAWAAASRLAQQVWGLAYGPELPVSISQAFAPLTENGHDLPEDFTGWQWGLAAPLGISTYASFAPGDDLLLTRTDSQFSAVLAAAQES
jgi:hypothetical protein